MKDAYSFDKDEAGLDKNYQAMHDAYKRIFKRCGLNFLTTEADPGVMGGSISHEFMAVAAGGEDIVLLCPACKSVRTFKEDDEDNCASCGAKADKLNTIEVGHIFRLGAKYSGALGANFLDAEGKLNPILMGCYGIGVSRLLSAIIEQNYDNAGIIWPNEVAPYKIIILPLDVTERKVMESAMEIYKDLQGSGFEVLLDDRDERAGVKFKDADLLGIPLQIIIGKEFLKTNTVELKIRSSNEKLVKPKAGVLEIAKKFINNAAISD
jgi:prolyl-tRNA synthetase